MSPLGAGATDKQLKQMSVKKVVKKIVSTAFMMFY